MYWHWEKSVIIQIKCISSIEIIKNRYANLIGEWYDNFIGGKRNI